MSPVSLLGAERLARYGRYAQDPSREQLARYFRLEGEDLRFVRRWHADHNRLGGAVQLGTVRFIGRFLPDPTDVPEIVIVYVADQLDVDPGCLSVYSQGRQANRHRKHARAICERYGYRPYADARAQLLVYLRARCSAAAERPSVVFDLATGWLREQRVLLPGATTLERDVAAVRDQAERELWQRIASTLDDEQREHLGRLLLVPYGSNVSALERLRRAPVSVSAQGLLGALKRLREIRAVGVGGIDAGAWPASRVAALARYGSTAKAQAIAQLTDDRRDATLLAIVQQLEVAALDDALDLFDGLLDKLLARVRRAGEKDRSRSLDRLDRAARQLRDAALVLTDGDYADVASLRAAVFEIVPREQLLQAARTVDALARPSEETEAEQLLSRYAFVRRFLPALVDTITFRAAPAGQPVLDAVDALRRIEHRRKIDPAEVPVTVLREPWLHLAIGAAGTLDKRAYTLGVLEQLRFALRRRDVFAPGSERWSDPRRRLLEGAAWKQARPSVCHSLKLPTDPARQLAHVSAQLDEAYRYVQETVDPAVIRQQAGKDRLHVPELESLPEPASLRRLRQQVWELVPSTELPALLLEVHQWTGFLDAFAPLGCGKGRIADIDISVCAALIADACNIGLEPLLDRHHCALSRDRLSWVDQNYLRAETIAAANALLVEHHSRLPLAQKFGTGAIASVDGLRFVVPVKTINAGPNPRYFGHGSGVTYLNGVSDQLAGFFAIVIPGTIRDSLYILDGLLEHDTGLEPQIIVTDTASYSDQVFGLFSLLGYQFAPRLADIPEQRFWRIDPAADYGPFNGLARHRINTRLIAQHWDDLLRIAGSLHRGTVKASQILRVLQGQGRPTTLGRALAEYGRIPKTLHLLALLGDEPYRRDMTIQLQKHEHRHRLARDTFHGQRGRLRQRYRQGQEDQLSALGLVLNAIVLWNTSYMTDAINTSAEAPRDEDLQRLSPLACTHINMLGRFHFELPAPVRQGQRRPLKTPERHLRAA